MPIAKCQYCSKEFRWMPSQTIGKYCSRNCQINGTLKEKLSNGTYTRANAFTYFRRHTEYKCSCCGIDKWNNTNIQLQIDHMDGNNKNNKLENLRYLCPNCHSQTETWGAKNISEEGSKRIKLAAKIGNAIQNGKLPKGTNLKNYNQLK